MNVFDLVATLKLEADGFYSALEQAGKAIFDFAKEAVETGAAFDQAMSKVEAIAGATSDEMDMLRKKALQSSGQTKFTAEETADALMYMGMAGWKAAEMMEGLDAVMALAAAGGEDVGRTSDIITDALTAFRQPASEAQHLADVLAVAMANSNTNINMLGESFKYAAPLAGQLGYSFEDVALALGLMANSGVKAGRAGRAINNFLTRLANPPKKAKEALDELGISLSDAEGNMYSFRDVMAELRLAMGGIDGGLDTESVGDYLTDTYTGLAKSLGVYEDFNDLLSGIYKGDYDLSGTLDAMQELFGDSFSWEDTVQFLRQSGSFTVNQLEKILALTESLGGKQALPALLAIIGASEEEFNDLAKALDNATGATEEMADTMLDNLSGDITILRSNLDLLRVSLSDRLSPTLRAITKSATTSIQRIREAYEKNGLNSALLTMIREAELFAQNFQIAILPTIKDVGNSLIDTFTIMAHDPKIRGPISEAISTLFGFVERFFTDNQDIIIEFSTLGARALAPVIKGFLSGIGPVIRDTLPDMIDDALAILDEIFDALINAIEENWPTIVITLQKVIMRVYEALDLDTILRGIPIIGSGLADVIKGVGMVWSQNTSAYDETREKISGLADALTEYSIAESNVARGMATENIVKTLVGLSEAFRSVSPELSNALDEYIAFFNGNHGVGRVMNENGDGWHTEWSVDTSQAETAQTYIDRLFESIAKLNQLNATVHVNVVANPLLNNVNTEGMSRRDMYGILNPYSFASGMSGGKILRGSTLFGFDASGRALYGGESGPEAVVGVNSLGQMIQQSVRGAFSGVSINDSQPVTIQLVLDSGEIVSIVETEIARNVQWKAGGRA